MILELKRYIQTVFIFYIAFIGGFNLCHAQKKQGKPLTPFFRKAGESKIVDRSVITAYYAFNAIKNDDISTYIDYQKLQIGKNIIKYCSEWIYQAEVKQDKFRQAHPHTNNVPHFLDFNKGEYWNEYQYSDYFIQLGKITVYTSMPFAADQYNCYYQEPYPLMKWSLCNEKCEILGYECQKATCLFRGRNYIAWFAPLIPVQHGPWKFGGLPGLILKVSDTQNIYTFECVRLTKQPQDITRRPFNGYEETKRTLVLKLARKFNENYDQATGATTRDNQGRVVMSQKQKYEPLELE